MQKDKQTDRVLPPAARVLHWLFRLAHLPCKQSPVSHGLVVTFVSIPQTTQTCSTEDSYNYYTSTPLVRYLYVSML